MSFCILIAILSPLVVWALLLLVALTLYESRVKTQRCCLWACNQVTAEMLVLVTRMFKVAMWLSRYIFSLCTFYLLGRFFSAPRYCSRVIILFRLNSLIAFYFIRVVILSSCTLLGMSSLVYVSVC